MRFARYESTYPNEYYLLVSSLSIPVYASDDEKYVAASSQSSGGNRAAKSKRAGNPAAAAELTRVRAFFSDCFGSRDPTSSSAIPDSRFPIFSRSISPSTNARTVSKLRSRAIAARFVGWRNATATSVGKSAAFFLASA